MKSILVISEKAETFRLLQNALSGSTVSRAADVNEALNSLHRKRYDLLLADLSRLSATPEDVSYRSIFRPFRQTSPSTEIIVMAEPAAIREAVMAVKAGAGNYLTYPLTPEEVVHVIESLDREQKKQSELDYLRDQFWETESLEIVRTRSLPMKQVFDKIRSAAPTRTTVILYGETGVGKGVIAGLIHRHSNRKDHPFISVHCGAIPDTLIESELFGHEKGAFTGAVRRKMGKFEISQGGTIFLDEVGTITPAIQIKLLQVLQDRTFQRVGGEVTIEANVRIIAASNADLKAMSDAGEFRKDLYYRLNVFPVEIPPLRKRTEDIPLLTEYFLQRLNRYYAKDIHGVHPAVIEAFARYEWPGNIREMENLIERAYILENSALLTPESFPSELFGKDIPAPQIQFSPTQTLAETRQKGIEHIERQYLKEVLTWNRGKINQSARDAGVSTRQLHKLLTKYNIRKEQFK